MKLSNGMLPVSDSNKGVTTISMSVPSSRSARSMFIDTNRLPSVRAASTPDTFTCRWAIDCAPTVATHKHETIMQSIFLIIFKQV